MSPALTTSSPGSSRITKLAGKGASTDHTSGRTHKTRVVRRRGRGRLDGIESDEEI